MARHLSKRCDLVYKWMFLMFVSSGAPRVSWACGRSGDLRIAC